MQKLLKRVLLCLLSLSLISGFALGNVQAFEKPAPKPMAWPGRPGNPDGIGVETHAYSCDQDWRYIRNEEGDTSDFDKNNWAKALLDFGISSGIGYSFPKLGIILGGLFYLTSLSPKEWEGERYRDSIYYSSNCIKIERKFYTRYWSLLSEKNIYIKAK